MRDLQTRRVFLKKTKIPPTLKESDFFLGADVLLLSRDLKLIEYADPQTKKLLEDTDERTTVCVLPIAFGSLGDIVTMVENAGYTLVDLKSTCFRDDMGAQAAAELLHVDPSELIRPQPLVAISFRGKNSVAAINELVKTSSFAGFGLCCPSSEDEALCYSNQFMSVQTRTTATFEECTCCLVKPHAIKERLVGAIFNEIVSRGFVVTALAIFRLERAAAAEFLEVYDGVVPEYNEMVDELCSGSLVAMEVRLNPSEDDRQEDVVEKFRSLAGPWDVNMAKELSSSSIRAKFGRDRIRNAIHCTDIPKDGIIEVEYFFNILSNSQYINGWK